MRNLLIVSGVALVIVTGLTIYSAVVLQDVQEYEEELAREYSERVEDLRGLDDLFKYEPRDTLDPERFDAYVEVRVLVTIAFEERKSSSRGGTWYQATTQNIVLRELRKGLQDRRMSLEEYRALSKRWQSLLALGEPKKLHEAWQAEVRTDAQSPPFALPEPPKEPRQQDLELLRAKADALRKTLAADLLGPLLDEISEG